MADVQSFTDAIDEEDKRVAVSIILLCSVLKLRQLRKRGKRRECVLHWLQRREERRPRIVPKSSSSVATARRRRFQKISKNEHGYFSSEYE